jgi:hypothetical protein
MCENLEAYRHKAGDGEYPGMKRELDLKLNKEITHAMSKPLLTI